MRPISIMANELVTAWLRLPFITQELSEECNTAAAEHKAENKAEHKAENKAEHKAEHRVEHKAEHRVEHKAECKAQHRAERDSAASGSIWDDWGGASGRRIGPKHVIRVWSRMGELEQ